MKEIAPVATAKLVRHGIYQYVRLPREFQFDADEVEIVRSENGLILKPPIESSQSRPRKKPKP